MTLTQHSLLKFSLAMMLVSCTSSRNASKGLVACKTAKDCPAGYTCEQVPNSDAIYRVCCKDKGCAIDTTPGMGVDGSSVTSQDGQSSAFEAGYLVDGQPLEASTNPDLPDTDLKTLDAMGTCGNDDDDCPTTAPMCLNHFCAACTTSIDCAGNPSGDLCNTTSGRCAFCLADTDCKDASKPLCGQGKCTACTYASIANGCCADTDCLAGGASTVGTCNTAAHSCGYACDATHKSCTTGGACIPKGSCCGDADCPGSAANECQYQGCLADATDRTQVAIIQISAIGAGGVCDRQGIHGNGAIGSDIQTITVAVQAVRAGDRDGLGRGGMVVHKHSITNSAKTAVQVGRQIGQADGAVGINMQAVVVVVAELVGSRDRHAGTEAGIVIIQEHARARGGGTGPAGSGEAIIFVGYQVVQCDLPLGKDDQPR